MRQTKAGKDGLSKTEEQQRLLMRRINQTKAQVWRVDLFSALMAAAAIGSFCLLFGILLDHLWTGGLPNRGRILYFVCCAVILLIYFIRRLIPFFRYRINPFYAADILEQNQPTLQNALINWLGLKKSGVEARSPLESLVQDGLTHQAAGGVEKINTEILVDHTPVIRWGIVLTIAVAVLSIYAVLSVKSPFVSASRILFPMADIDPPQRVRFVSITPGDVSCYRGETVSIQAEIAGVKGTPVRMVWGTADRRKTDQEILMNPMGGNLYELTFPPDGTLEEPITYQIKVGKPGRRESTSPEFRIDVRPPLSFDVESVTYQYPDYTGLEPMVQNGTGAVEAVAGTTVTVKALSSEPIGKGFFIPEFSLRRAVLMTIDPENPNKASYTWTLDRSKRASDADRPEWTSYQLMVADANGVRNLEEPENPENGIPSWEIRLKPDLSPEIDWCDSLPAESTAALNEKITVQVKAHDPDFALRRVTLCFEYPQIQGEERLRQEKPIPPIELLKPVVERGPSPHQGEVTLSGTFSPKELGLAAGGQIEFYAQAEDSRLPDPNRAQTSRRRLTITETNPAIPEEDQEQNPDEESKEEGSENSDDGSNESNQSDANAQTGENGDPSGAGDQENESGGNQSGSDEQTPQSSENGSESGNPESGESESGESNPEGNSASGQQNTESGSGESGTSDGENGGTDSPENTDDTGDNANDGANGNENNTGDESDNLNPPQNQPNSGNGTGENSSDSPQEPNQDQNPPSGNGSGEGKENSSQSGSSDGENNSPRKDNPSNGEPSEKPSEPIDPEMNPGDAFEKILDHCAECNGGNCPLPNPNAPKAGGNTNSGQPSNEKPEDPASLPNGTGTLPEDAPRHSDPNPGEIPADAQRQQGEVDPNTQNYMATDGEASNTEAPQNANVTMDPNGTQGGTPASESEKQNSRQANGTPSNGPTEGGTPADTPNPTGAESGNQSNQTASGGTPTAGGTPAGNESSSDGPSSPNSGNTPGTDSESQEGHNAGSSDQPGGNDTPREGRAGGGGADRGNQINESKAAAADAAHLDYSEAATALALEHLDDQIKNGPDPALLKELGWTKEELAAFARRWKQMKDSVRDLPAGDPKRREYNEELMNMGLWETPPASMDHQAASDENRQRSSLQNGPRTAPPAGYSDRFRAYTEGISRRK